MIRLLLLCIIIMFFLWLVISIFTTKKNDKIKFKIGSKLIFFILIIVIGTFLIKFFPKILAIIPKLQIFLAPIVNILKTFIPF